MAIRGLAVALLAALGLGAGARAAPLRPIERAPAAIPFAQLIGSAETLGEWKLLNGNGDLQLIRVLSKEGRECGQDDADDADTCPRYVLFVVVDGELADPTQYTAFQLPETLGWSLPKDFRPNGTAERTTIPLRACEMRKTAKGVGWRGVSYTLAVTEKIEGGSQPFTFTASLDKLPGERPDCGP
jgi:hypothetical protein